MRYFVVACLSLALSLLLARALSLSLSLSRALSLSLPPSLLPSLPPSLSLRSEQKYRDNEALVHRPCRRPHRRYTHPHITCVLSLSGHAQFICFQPCSKHAHLLLLHPHKPHTGEAQAFAPTAAPGLRGPVALFMTPAQVCVCEFLCHTQSSHIHPHIHPHIHLLHPHT